MINVQKYSNAYLHILVAIIYDDLIRTVSFTVLHGTPIFCLHVLQFKLYQNSN